MMLTFVNILSMFTLYKPQETLNVSDLRVYEGKLTFKH